MEQSHSKPALLLRILPQYWLHAGQEFSCSRQNPPCYLQDYGPRHFPYPSQKAQFQRLALLPASSTSRPALLGWQLQGWLAATSLARPGCNRPPSPLAARSLNTLTCCDADSVLLWVDLRWEMERPNQLLVSERVNSLVGWATWGSSLLLFVMMLHIISQLFPGF